MPIYILSYLPVSIQNSNLLMVIGGTDSNSRMMILLGPIFAKPMNALIRKTPKKVKKKAPGSLLPLK